MFTELSSSPFVLRLMWTSGCGVAECFATGQKEGEEGLSSLPLQSKNLHPPKYPHHHHRLICVRINKASCRTQQERPKGTCLTRTGEERSTLLFSPPRPPMEAVAPTHLQTGPAEERRLPITSWWYGGRWTEGQLSL